MKRTLLKQKTGFKRSTLEQLKEKQLKRNPKLIGYCTGFLGKKEPLEVIRKARRTFKTALKLKAKKPKVVTITKRKKDLWKIVSPFIRNRDLKMCITCGKEAVHAGHFLPSGNCGALLRYHPRNIHGQCYFCNINLGGNGAVYYTKMVEKYGQDYVNKLFTIKNQTTIKADEYFYLTLTDLYKQGNQEEIIKFLESYL